MRKEFKLQHVPTWQCFWSSIWLISICLITEQKDAFSFLFFFFFLLFFSLIEGQRTSHTWLLFLRHWWRHHCRGALTVAHYVFPFSHITEAHASLSSHVCDSRLAIDVTSRLHKNHDQIWHSFMKHEHESRDGGDTNSNTVRNYRQRTTILAPVLRLTGQARTINNRKKRGRVEYWNVLWPWSFSFPPHTLPWPFLQPFRGGNSRQTLQRMLTSFLTHVPEYTITFNNGMGQSSRCMGDTSVRLDQRESVSELSI